MVMVKSLCVDCRPHIGLLFSLITASAIFHWSAAYGAEWEFTPRLSVAEIYTDNIRHTSSGKKKSDFATLFAPAISIKGTGRHFDFNLNHRTQFFVLAREFDKSRIFNRMQADGNAELYENLFFVDVRSSVRQQAISTQNRLAIGNLPLTRNRTNVITFRVSPYLKHNFNDYVNAELRYAFNLVDIQRGASSSISHQINFTTTSGDELARLFWRGNYRRQYTNRSGRRFRVINGIPIIGSNVRFERANLLAGYRLTDEFALLTEGGYANNHFKGRRGRIRNGRRRIRNGFYWAAGLGWEPSRYFSAEAVYGPRYQRASVNFTPHTRLSMQLTWRNRDVGLNPGNAYFGTLQYRSRFSLWSARYFVSTVTFQGLQTGQSVFEQDPLTNDVVLGPGDEFILSNPSQGIFPVTDEVMVRKRFQLRQTYNKGNTKLRFTFFKENRKFLQTLRERGGLGGNATWNWQFARQLSSNLSFFAQDFTISENNRSSLFWFAQASLVRNFNRHLQGSISFRHSERGSSQGESGTGFRGFKENRVTAQFSYTF